MLYLVTGANGTFKTALTLRDVRAKSIAENRPVAYNGRFRMKADFGWKLIEAKDWEKEPDGTIFFFDECQNDFPVRTGRDAPRYITQLAEHRVRGFDFFLLSQHPLNIDAFVRRLIGSPGWHRHHKRVFGASMVSVLEWPSVNSNCDKAGAGESGTVTTVLAPTEVYDWYESATLHTAKTKIPARVWVFAACVLLAPLLVYYAYSKFTGGLSGRDNQISKLAGKDPAGLSPNTASQAGSGRAADRQPMTTAEYVASYVPRVQGVPQSAPRYDELTRPTQAPRPAACVHGVRRGTRESVCKCWSQQATALDVPDAVCRQIAAGGYFDDTLPPPRDTRESLATARPALVASPAVVEPQAVAFNAGSVLSPPETKSTVSRDADVMQFMAKRKYIN